MQWCVPSWSQPQMPPRHCQTGCTPLCYKGITSSSGPSLPVAVTPPLYTYSSVEGREQAELGWERLPCPQETLPTFPVTSSGCIQDHIVVFCLFSPKSPSSFSRVSDWRTQRPPSAFCPEQSHNYYFVFSVFSLSPHLTSSLCAVLSQGIDTSIQCYSC